MNKATLLVVDDDRLILFALANGLREAGYTVIEANSGERAIEICGDITPDLAILDMRMRGLSGLDVAGWFKEHNQTPFIFLSAYDDRETVEGATTAGALGYLVKPVDTHQILPTIRAALKRGEEIRQLREMEKNLTNALGSSREISVAMGILMERHHIAQQDAFEKLRAAARNQRRKATEVAGDIISGDMLD